MATLLVVDDDPDLLILLEAHYGARGHLVVVAGSCEEALEKASKQKPDAVLLDFCLPKMDGARFIEILRADPLTKSVPIIVMTAASASWVASRLPKDPLIKLIDKPFDFVQLDPLIQDALSAKA